MKTLLALLLVACLSTPAAAGIALIEPCATPQGYLIHQALTPFRLVNWAFGNFGRGTVDAGSRSSLSLDEASIGGDLFGVSLSIGTSPKEILLSPLGIVCLGWSEKVEEVEEE